jgi:hypothetical protein
VERCILDASGSVAGPCEHGNATLCSIKDGEFLDYLNNC